jgi:hypothetical protein
MPDDFQSALEWSKKNFENLKQQAASIQVKTGFDWKKALPDIALIIMCVTVILLAIMFMIKNFMSPAQTVDNNQATNGLMQQNHRPSDIAYNAIPILT